MRTVTVLGEAVGVQRQKVTDRSGSAVTNRLTNGLIIGFFKRGRTDKAMLIDQTTIRSRLGYEPKNLSYQAVQDALDTGISSVWVLRVSNSESAISWLWEDGQPIAWEDGQLVETEI